MYGVLAISGGSSCELRAIARPKIVAIPADGKVFYVANRSGNISEWSTSDWHVIRHFSREFDGVSCVAVAPDGRDLVVGSRSGWRRSIWRTCSRT